MIERIREICGTGPVIPVIEIDDAANAKPLADALLRGGIQVIEITLRTTDALKAIEVIANETNMCVGAGTILTPQDLMNSRNAGAAFGVSPGSTPALLP